MNLLFDIPLEGTVQEEKPQLFIRNGKIVDKQGNVVRPELGNKQHQRLIEEYAKYKIGISIKIEKGPFSSDEEGEENFSKIHPRFRCSCGWIVSNPEFGVPTIAVHEKLEDYEDIFFEEIAMCLDCGQKYNLFEDEKGHLKANLI